MVCGKCEEMLSGEMSTWKTKIGTGWGGKNKSGLENVSMIKWA
jgi:hypothetical protein